MNDHKTLIREFVVQNFLFGRGDDLTDSTSFFDHGIIDSTGVLELVAYLEKSFNIKVEDAEMIPDNVDSIAAMAAYLERKRTVSK
jgi:acyl carrier protein